VATHELTPEPDPEHGFADPGDVWGLPERTAQDAPELTQVEQRRLRAQAALALKVRGADYGEIASVLEYANAAGARNAVETLLAEITEGDGPQAWMTQRNLARLRYEGLLAAVYPIATDNTDEGFFQAQRQAAVLVDRITVLDGLNAPQRHVIMSPEAAEFDATIQKVLEASGVTKPHEADIFELAEIVIEPEDAEEGELDAIEAPLD
jgi:hypothetical protein